MPSPAPVIVIVDLGPRLECLAQCGQRLARCEEAPLAVVHVVQRYALAEAVNNFDYGELLLDELADPELRVEEKARRLLEPRLADLGVSAAAIKVLAGSPARAVSERAEHLRARLLVLGSPKSPFGSVATHAARHAPCDVHICRKR